MSETYCDLARHMEAARLLRQAGFGKLAQDILLPLTNHSGDSIEKIQLGIDMNYAGLFSEASIQIQAALSMGGVSDYNLFIALSELSIAQFSLGMFPEGLENFRKSRRMTNELIPAICVESEDITSKLKGKFLGDRDPVCGRTVLVLLEGGFGDLVMHTRYIGLLRKEGAKRIFVFVPSAASGIFAENRDIEEIRTREDFICCLDATDFVTTNFSLFSRYQETPYINYWNELKTEINLFKNAVLTQPLESLIDSSESKIKVGLITASNTAVRHEPFRSMQSKNLAKLIDAYAERIAFFSLNRGVENAIGNNANVVDLGGYLETYADTASVLRKFDLLISIDTGPAHLAAALDIPVWLLLSAACDYRWFADRDFTPWYASMQLFRQSTLGDWSQPISAVIEKLPSLFDSKFPKYSVLNNMSGDKLQSQRIAQETWPCKICGSNSLLCGLVDFSICGADRLAGKKIDPYIGVPVYYRQCENCGFVFTTAFDGWSPQDYQRNIYNDDYSRHDPDFMGARPLQWTELICSSFPELSSKHILDYGSGLGLLAQNLAQRGFQNVHSYDPYNADHEKRLLPDSRFDIVLAIEVFEHHPDPVHLIADLDVLLEEDGIIFFSTLLVEPAIIESGISNWWYCAPRNGHISFYSTEALAKLASKKNLSGGSFNNSIHFFCKGEIPSLISRNSHTIFFNRNFR